MTLLKPPTTMGNLTRRGALATLGSGVLTTGLLGSSIGARAASPAKGGTLKIGSSAGNTVDSLDPTTYIDFHMYTIGFTLGNNLIELSPSKEPLPELAESWEGSADAKRWAFRIRKGVEFHNGKTLTPADVVYSLNRHIGEKSESAAKGFLAGVSAIRADGDNVIIEHDTGDADIPIIMGDFHLQIVPEGHDDWSTFIGTGPYVLENFDPGVSFAATRNPNYWKSGSAWVDAVEMVFVTDPTARSSALIAGKVNMIDRVDNKVVDRITSLGRYNLIEAVGGRYQTTVMDVRAAPFDNAHVREAVKYAINREQQVEKVFRGYAVPANDHPIPPSDPFYHSELPQRPYDPDKAKWHLKEAGLDSLTIDLSTSDQAFPGAIDSAVLMQSDAIGSGLTINVKREPSDGYWSNVWMKKPYVMSNWATRPTPGMMFSIAYACGAPWAEAFWCNDRFEKLLVEGKTETDFEKRKAIYWEMQELANKDSGNAVFVFTSELDAYADEVQGAVSDGLGRLHGGRIAERVWIG